jgi:hypothetical protein
MGNLVGKGGHIRTVRIPAWVKTALNQWIRGARVTEGGSPERSSDGQGLGAGISQNVVWYVVKSCCERAEIKRWGKF